MNVFNALRSQPEQLAALLWATPYAQANWRDVLASETPDSLEQARLAIAESRMFYCGGQGNSTFSIQMAANNRPVSETWADWFRRILPAAARLRTVQLLCEDALKAIDRVAHREDALLYVDPPYSGHESEYRCGVDYAALAAVLQVAKAKVLISEYPDGAERWFSTWRRVERNGTRRAATGGAGHRGTRTSSKTEVLLLNF